MEGHSLNNDRSNNNNWGDIIYWIVTIVFLCTAWPIGLILLFRKVMGYTNRSRRSQHPYDIQREQQQAAQQGQSGDQGQASSGNASAASRQQAAASAAKAGSTKKKSRRPPTPATKGKPLIVLGSVITALFGLTTLGVFSTYLSLGFLSALQQALIPLGLTAAGLVLLYAGIQRNRKGKRYRRYQALIGSRKSISIHALAEALSLPYQTVCEELQDMLDEGIFPVGYVNIMEGRLVLNNEGLEDDEPEEKREDTPLSDRASAILKEIRQVNDDIADPELSAKIDRIEQITGKIFAYLESHPEKESQLRSFLNYYLPTTLKILHAYAQLEAQGIEGENISAAKERIENMMDKVVEGFEKQLDQLFQDSTLDITTDVQVLERMLDKDGLSSSGDGMTLGM